MEFRKAMGEKIASLGELVRGHEEVSTEITDEELQMGRKELAKIKHVYDVAINQTGSYKDRCVKDMEKQYMNNNVAEAGLYATYAAQADLRNQVYQKKMNSLNRIDLIVSRPRTPAENMDKVKGLLGKIKVASQIAIDKDRMNDITNEINEIMGLDELEIEVMKENEISYVSGTTVKEIANGYMDSCKAKYDQQKMQKESNAAIIRQNMSYAQLPELKPME
jgi:hypothetical protein